MSKNTIHPCSICMKEVHEKTDAIYCDLCLLWVHRSCNKINKSDFLKLTKSPEGETWWCLKCNNSIFPFMSSPLVGDDSNGDSKPKSLRNEHNDFFNDMNSAQSNSPYDLDLENPVGSLNCKYYDMSDFKSLNPSNFFSFLHLNISSINKHLDNFLTLLHSLQHHFKVIAITETRISKSNSHLSYDIQDYHCYSTPTEAQAGGTSLYVSNTLNSTPRTDLDKILYKSKILESTFAEIDLPKQSNIIVGSIYKHPSLNISEFDCNYIQPLLDKISKENKTIILLGDFNINLLHSSTDPNISNFLDTLGDHLILPQITLPTRITAASKTLIDNIFLSPVKHEKISGNLTTGVSDHLPQFLLIKKHYNHYNHIKFARDWKNFYEENFLIDFLSSDWDDLLSFQEKNPDHSFDSFLNRIENLLNQYAPLRRLTKKQRLESKPWITTGLKKSIYLRDKLLNKYIKCKDPNKKTALHNEYKAYRNMIVTLLRKSKHNHFSKFFHLNSKNSKKIWEGINSYLNRRKNSENRNITLTINDNTITDPQKVADIFNKYFTTIADDIRSKIPKFFNNPSQYLTNPLPNSFFFSPISIDEMTKTLQSLSTNKASGPNSIPTKILNLLLPDIADILTRLFNLSFETGIFLTALKPVKVIPVFKDKGSSQDFNNYRPNPCFLILIKFSKNLYIQDWFPF